jgi:hypothetical protein
VTDALRAPCLAPHRFLGSTFGCARNDSFVVAPFFRLNATFGSARNDAFFAVTPLSFRPNTPLADEVDSKFEMTAARAGGNSEIRIQNPEFRVLLPAIGLVKKKHKSQSSVERNFSINISTTFRC